ncbi:acetyl-coenzyme A synthetase: cytoplasmic-like isoform X3 [Leptotrombidium deliense]|uniref:Acetyl-coenzyme A synthetase n=1 Tax=Leptotrombidium deliense TaxID=299467 RepID=A0A443SHH2_9ACAR|nr:acetyl-coenzyme A synthetase: cytoplasmic-like isoform X3 [Leptotrombidium deliense]
MSKVIYPSEEQERKSLVGNLENYKKLYQNSIADPEAFWSGVAKGFHWHKNPETTNILKYNFNVNEGPINIQWMDDGMTNICYNALDRWVQTGYGNKVAYIWNGNECEEQRKVTYAELHNLGIKTGDHVTIYMPVTIELVVAMLACARIGAIHVVVFAGFSANALADRIIDAKCETVITANGVFRGPKFIALKSIVDEAINICETRNHKLRRGIVYKHSEYDENNNAATTLKHSVPFLDWDKLMSTASSDCEPVWLNSEHPLFVLYTSGSTGKPKGMVHTTAGYMVYCSLVFKYVFNYNESDIYFCTADLGWITGHTHNVYGGLLNRATMVLFDGVPTYPTPSRLWQIVDAHDVNILYTAPTAVRTLMRLGDEHVTSCNRNSLKLLAVVGEPIDPESWKWFHNVVGNGKCPIVDTFFQTETAAPMIAPLPGCTPLKPGSATLPFFGIQPAILNDKGEELEGPCDGYLVFKYPWPGIARRILGDNNRFAENYFRKFPNYYFTGDGCRRDEDGYYWVTGRIDDTVNVSGHLLSTAEVEGVLMENPAVAEAAVVGAPHEIKGQCLHCFVVLKNGIQYSEDLKAKLRSHIREKIGPLYDPERIIDVQSLPKTRSGKIVRRILRKLAVNDTDFGDTSTLVEDNSVNELLRKTVAA